MKFKNLLIKLGLIDFKIGDKVKPNPKIFKEGFQIVKGQEYAKIRKVEKSVVYLYDNKAPYSREELILCER